MKLTLQKFTHKWSDVLNQAIVHNVNHFILEKRIFDLDQRASTEFLNGKIYTINVKKKQVFCYAFERVEILFDQEFKNSINEAVHGLIQCENVLTIDITGLNIDE